MGLDPRRAVATLMSGRDVALAPLESPPTYRVRCAHAELHSELCPSIGVGPWARQSGNNEAYVSHCRPQGLSVADGCRLMGIACSLDPKSCDTVRLAIRLYARSISCSVG
jgi:hypothetical protein